MELTSNYKTGRQFFLSIHIVAITRQCYLNFHMGIKGPVIIYHLGGVGGFWAKHDEI